MKRKAIFLALVLLAASAPGVAGIETSPGETPADADGDMASRSPVRHAANDTWTIAMVDSLGKTGQHTDIACSANDTIFISYHDFLDENLRCAYGDSGTWEVDTVDAGGAVGTYTSIDVDSDGQPRISYHDETNGDLRYAVRDSDGWQVETADSTGDVGRYASLAVDGQGTPHIVYYDATGRDMKYATRNNGNWNTETVASDGDAGRYAAIALDGQGRPHCTYGVDETTLMYAYRTGSGWETSQVESDIKLFESTAITIEDGTCHIGYFDTSEDTNWRLKYANDAGGAWTIEVVDPDIYGFWNERGLDIVARDGVVHIGYFHWDDWDVGYAYRYDGRWITEIVERQGDVGAFAAIALDSQGYPRMSYMDRSNLGLKYARKTAYAPATPAKPTGVERGRTGSEYTYATSTGDLDGDDVEYGWDWNGDQQVDEWTTPVASGAEIETTHAWDSDGAYTVRVKARDGTGLESDWSQPLQVSMPYRSISRTMTLWRWLAQHLPFLSPLFM